MITRTTSLSILALAVAGTAAMTPQSGSSGGGGGGGGSSSERPKIHIVTPGFENPRDAVIADVLVDRIEYADGVRIGANQFVYPGQILNFLYTGPLERLRVMNGPQATVGAPGVSYIEAQDGNPASISVQDRNLFCGKVEQALGNNNVNNRVHLAAQSGYSFIVGLESRFWGRHFSLDNRPELFIFEEQGNSVMTIQPLDDDLQPIGTAVEVRAVDIASIQPEKVWVGRFNNAGQPQSGTYELKMFSVDLTRLGVTHLKYFALTTQISGGGEASADFKIIAVDTSPAPAAQTMTFD
ncbi:MAG: hypothetical protein ACO3IB_09830 [Phycisphaerales bacterium]